jgi:hypothetical protein
MHILKFAVPAAILSVGLMVNTTASFAKLEFSKKESKGCPFCHVKTGSKELNGAGTYYKDHKHSLEGYKAEKK